MKKVLPVLTVFILIIIIVSIFLSMSSQKKMVTIQEGNHEHKPLDITLNHYQDTQCGMTIETLVHSVQAVAPDGKTWFFDDVGCFALWYKNIKFQKKATIWFIQMIQTDISTDVRLGIIKSIKHLWDTVSEHMKKRA